MKRCCRCERELPLEAFCKNRRAADGLQYFCKECHQARRNPVRESVQAQAWNNAHPERHAAARNRYEARHRTERRQASARWYDEHRDEINARRRERQEERWAAIKADPERHARVREHARQGAARRRARRGDPDSALYTQILKQDPCTYCGHRAGELDHIEPVIRDGLDHWTNLTAACRPCNAGKAARPLLVFLAERK